MSEKLSFLDNSSDSEVELTVNKSYANSYNQWRNKEELQKYKDLKKEEEDSESSSDSEEEIPEFDEEFFRALSLLKGKDPRLFDKNFELFKEKETVKKPKAVKPKPMYMKDYERNLVLERGGKFSDEDEEDNAQERIPTYDEEQEELKKSFKEAVRNLDEADEDNDDLLQVRSKTEKEEEAEEEDYVKWLKGEEKNVSDDIKQDMSYLRSYWNDPKLGEDEKFLRDYILNKRYLEKDDSEIPTYEELTSGMLSDDEKIIEEQDKFEHKYNFRFEEPDEEFIKRYPRTVGDSLRRADTRRKQKREETTERKRKDKEQRREELKRLKALKRKEIEEKFMKLKEISGQDEINLNESDMESDFDPDKHDKKMSEMFNEEYYQVEEGQKPEFPFDEELDAENWNAWAGEKIIDDEDIEENDEDLISKEKNKGSDQEKLNPREEFANEMINASQPKKKVKKKSLFAKIISQQKPVYDPDGKSFEEYLDEYYKLDFEDIVADLPVRYKYRKVIPNDFGLSVDEILTADDRELNRWCSVKKTCQYRKDEEELYDVQAFHKRAQNPEVKKKFLPSVYAPKQSEEPSVDSTNLSQEEVNNTEVQDSDNAVQNKKMNVQSNFNCTMDDKKERLDSSVQSRKSKKKRKRKSHQENQNTSGNDKLVESAQFTEDQDTSSMDINNKSYVTNGVKRNRQSKPEVYSNQQLVKKKKLIDCSLSVDSDSVANGSDNDMPKKFKNEHESQSQLNVSENASEVSVKKKKKKKKKKNKHRENTTLNNDSSLSQMPNNNASVSQGDKPKTHHSKFKNKYKQHVTEDKRLGLSDARLSAYGINPKKFKNKIIYSKK